METWEKSKHISRILCGEVVVVINNTTYYIKSPSRLQRHLAEGIYEEQYMEAKKLLKCEKEINELLCFFSNGDQKLMDVLEKDVENLKETLYSKRNFNQSLPKVREALQMTVREYERLYNLKHAYDHMTPQGIASSAKLRYLLGCSIYLEDFSPYWTKHTDWSKPDNIIDSIAFEINKDRLSEKQFREIARTDPWRSLWSIQKHCKDPIFPGSSFDLNDDQKNIIIWSSMYDSFREHPDNLPDFVLDDDDMLDGWMILKRKERDKEQNKKSIDGITDNEKIRNASEQFIFADNIEAAQEIINMNDYESLSTFQQRVNKIKSEGMVEEQHMPDSILRIQQQRMESMAVHAKRR